MRPQGSCYLRLLSLQTQVTFKCRQLLTYLCPEGLLRTLVDGPPHLIEGVTVQDDEDQLPATPIDVTRLCWAALQEDAADRLRGEAGRDFLGLDSPAQRGREVLGPARPYLLAHLNALSLSPPDGRVVVEVQPPVGSALHPEADDKSKDEEGNSKRHG